MATSHSAPCPHCKSPLTFLEGVSGAVMMPKCPRCRKPVTVPSSTVLVANYSRPPKAQSHT